MRLYSDILASVAVQCGQVQWMQEPSNKHVGLANAAECCCSRTYVSLGRCRNETALPFDRASNRDRKGVCRYLMTMLLSALSRVQCSTHPNPLLVAAADFKSLLQE
jgi:hypothetical protein